MIYKMYIFFIVVCSFVQFCYAQNVQAQPNPTPPQTTCQSSPLLAYQQILQKQLVQTPPTPILNINNASAAQLTMLKGIGANKAKAIVDYRNTHGAFVSIDELEQIHGIGKKTILRLKEKLVLY